MLENANLSRVMLKEEYKTETLPLKERLSGLQHRIKDEKLPVLVLFEGWGTAGKGEILSDVLLTLDPRNFKSKSTLPPTADEQRHPFMWRHWNSLPERGLLGLYDRSWYPEVITGATHGTAPALTRQHLDSINIFERQLADDGTLLIKIFLHISQKEQKKRLDKLAEKKSTAWRVTRADYKRNKNYPKLYRTYDDMLETTHTPSAPWHIVSGQDARAATADAYRIIVEAIEAAFAQREAAGKKKPAKPKAPTPGPFTVLQMPTLAEVSLDKHIEGQAYKERLKEVQKKLKKLHNKVYLKKIPIVIGYEGWDASGKGGNIRRLTAALDPRGYEVVPIASPTPVEKAHHYLWRFWTQLPKDGHITLFDRTWYGRVMVERIEGFASAEEWHRAYREINEFEHDLHQWGAIVLKFWLHISKEEQLRRFEARKLVPEKQWKITDEDWRNREKWDAYEDAVNDMLRLTSTDFAPWTIIESEDKRFARIKALETVIAAIEARL